VPPALPTYEPSVLKDVLPFQDIYLLAYRGSIAHGMYIPGSDPNSIDDVDLMGIVIGQPEHYFGLQEWGSRGTKEIKQGKYDVVLYEIRKMFSLLTSGQSERAEHPVVPGRGLSGQDARSQKDHRQPSSIRRQTRL
jgi:hypothetical protein